jgi:hypothetical protein
MTPDADVAVGPGTVELVGAGAVEHVVLDRALFLAQLQQLPGPAPATSWPGSSNQTPPATFDYPPGRPGNPGTIGNSGPIDNPGPISNLGTIDSSGTIGNPGPIGNSDTTGAPIP